MTGTRQASRLKETWFRRMFGNVRGSIGRMDYFKGVLLLWLIIVLVGRLFAGREDLWQTLHAGTPDEIKKLVFPALMVPVRFVWMYFDTKRLRSLGLPVALAVVAHIAFIVDQFIPEFALPGLAGMIFIVYVVCLILLPSRTKIIAHSRTGRKLTILGMEEKG